MFKRARAVCRLGSIVCSFLYCAELFFHQAPTLLQKWEHHWRRQGDLWSLVQLGWEFASVILGGIYQIGSRRSVVSPSNFSSISSLRSILCANQPYQGEHQEWKRCRWFFVLHGYWSRKSSWHADRNTNADETILWQLWLPLRECQTPSSSMFL